MKQKKHRNWLAKFLHPVEKFKEILARHPKGLWVLIFTHLPERLGHYAIQAILVLYLSATIVAGGLGWKRVDAYDLLGVYIAVVYLACLPGGLIADRRVFGWQISKKYLVLIGGFILCAGHLTLALPFEGTLYPALALIALGVGLQKPNIQAMIKDLYKDHPDLSGEGNSLFYMGVNIGALLATVLVGYVVAYFGWHAAFSMAGISMAIGQVIYMRGIWKTDLLTEVGEFVKPTLKDEKAVPLTKHQWHCMGLLIFVIGVCLLFWSAFDQIGGSINFFVDELMQKNVLGIFVPTATWQGLNPLFVIGFTLVVTQFWLQMAKWGVVNSDLFKLGVGVTLAGGGFYLMLFAAQSVQLGPDGAVILQAHWAWLVFAYLLLSIGEICVMPVAYNLIQRLAPPQYNALFFGVLFASTGAAGYVAHQFGQLSETYGHAWVYESIGLTCVLVGIGVAILSKPLDRLSHGKDGGPVVHPEDLD